MDNPQALGSGSHLVELLFPQKALLHLLSNVGQLHQHTLLLRVAVSQTHLLDLDLTCRQLFLAEDDGEGNTVALSRLELVLQLGLLFIEELGLSCG